MIKPIGYYAGARAEHPDASVLDQITERFGSTLQELNRDDKAAVLICLVDAAVNPQQVFIQDNFFSSQNGGQLWQLSQGLTPSNQLALCVALLEQITYGGR